MGGGLSWQNTNPIWIEAKGLRTIRQAEAELAKLVGKLR